MTRREALAALALALALIAAGLTWLLGPYGLLTAGVALAALVLWGTDITEERRAEVVEPAQRRQATRRGVPL